MFVLPMFLIADAAPSVRFIFNFMGWCFAIGGIILGYFAALKYVPAARCVAGGPGGPTGGRKRAFVHEGCDPGRGPRDATPPAHEQSTEAD